MSDQFLDFPGLRARLQAEPLFGQKMLEMCERLGLVPDYILSVMSLESGVNPQAVNPKGGATGLIQFMPPTAIGLGTTTAALKDMTGVEQLRYVERFFEQNGRKIRPDTPGDYYMAVFMPLYVGADPNTVLGVQGSTEHAPGTDTTLGVVYDENKSLDRNHDGTITVSDLWQATLSRIADAKTRPPIEVTEPGPLGPPAPSPSPPSLPPAWRSSQGPSDLPVLRIGAKGTAVTLAQVLLGCDVITGVYTDAMAQDYVRPFQSKRGLVPDAVIGQFTWEELATSSQ